MQTIIPLVVYLKAMNLQLEMKESNTEKNELLELKFYKSINFSKKD